MGDLGLDLYYRLATLTIALPALRGRSEDIPTLVVEFLEKYGRNNKCLSPKILKSLEDYSWPGNIRELDCYQTIFRATWLSGTG